MGDQVELGDRVQDRISNFSGIVVSVTDWLYGCRRIGVQPETLASDGKQLEPGYFDEQQLRVVLKHAIAPVAAPAGTPAAESQLGTGGPARETAGFSR